MDVEKSEVVEALFGSRPATAKSLVADVAVCVAEPAPETMPIDAGEPEAVTVLPEPITVRLLALTAKEPNCPLTTVSAVAATVLPAPVDSAVSWAAVVLSQAIATLSAFAFVMLSCFVVESKLTVKSEPLPNPAPFRAVCRAAASESPVVYVPAGMVAV